MIRAIINLYRPRYIHYLVYMLQATEYRYDDFLRWYWQVRDFGTVAYRRDLDKTPKARLLLFMGGIIYLIFILAGLSLVYEAFKYDHTAMYFVGFGLVLIAPVITAHTIILPLLLGHVFIQKPIEKRRIDEAKTIFANHPGQVIGVLGSYGKTTTKEVLREILSAGLKVKATTGNKNTALSIANFAGTLEGDEDVVVVEFGEYQPGDIAMFAQIVQPNTAVITGLSEAHLDNFGSLDNIASELLSIANYVNPDSLYINLGSPKLADLTPKDLGIFYSETEVAGHKLKNIKCDLSGTSFEVSFGKRKYKLNSKLLGRHNVATLGLGVYLAHQFGLKKPDIETAVAKTEPFEHRLELNDVGGAVIIDDTYNGNIDGMRAAIEFVGGLGKKFKRKIYVTPGLVETGQKKVDLHQELGRLIAPVFDEVVLMNNSSTEFIMQGLEEADFKGELQVVDDPLGFYNSLDQFVAKGDLVLMQNDLTDNYL